MYLHHKIVVAVGEVLLLDKKVQEGHNFGHADVLGGGVDGVSLPDKVKSGSGYPTFDFRD